jgi:hypothetical protein
MGKAISITFKVHLTTRLFYCVCRLFLESFRSCINILQNMDHIVFISVNLANSFQVDSFIPISNRMMLFSRQEIDKKIALVNKIMTRLISS